MQKMLDEILADLIEIDPGFAKMESEIRILANKMLAAKPDSAIDSEFKKELKNRLLARAEELKNAPQKSSFNFFPMQKFFFALAGAAVAIAVFVGFQNYDRIFAPSLDLSDSENSLAFDGEQKIAALGERAFGSLVSPTDLTSSTAGKGGGGGFASEAVSDEIRVEPDFEVYRYVYDGPINFPVGQVEVLRRVKNFESTTGIANSLAQFDFGIVDFGAMQNLEIQSFNLNENRDFGYSAFVNFEDGSISVNQNWQKWPDPYRDCSDSICYENLRLQKSDMLADDAAIALADDFVQKFGVNLQNYGAPEIQYNWALELARFTGDESEFYFPESVSVVYPLELDGKTVYTSGGTPDGITVTVNQRFKRAVGIYGLNTQNYESSNYAAVSDENLFRDVLAKGGMWGGYYPDGAKVVEVQLGEPTEVWLKYWNYNSGESEELILPALRFPIIENNPNVYQTAVVVPLVAEILEEQNSVEPPILYRDDVLEVQKVEADAE